MNAEPETRTGVAWHLRTPEGTVYGPAPTATLRTWAEQGRIGPGCHVSADRSEWMPAESLKALDLSWRVDAGSEQFYGPLNLAAIQDLVREGTIPDSAQLVHVHTGAKTTVREQLDRKTRQDAEQQDRLAALQRENAEKAARIQQIEEALRAHEKTEREKEQLADRLAHAEERNVRRGAETAELRRRLDGITARLEESNAKLHEERRQRELGELELVKKERSLDDTLARLQEKERQIEELAKRHEQEAIRWRHKVRALLEERIRELEEESRAVAKRLRLAKQALVGGEPAEHTVEELEEADVERIPARSTASPVAPAAAPDLERLEAQAQRELEAWVAARRGADRKVRDMDSNENPRIPPRGPFGV